MCSQEGVSTWVEPKKNSHYVDGVNAVSSSTFRLAVCFHNCHRGGGVVSTAVSTYLMVMHMYLFDNRAIVCALALRTHNNIPAKSRKGKRRSSFWAVHGQTQRTRVGEVGSIVYVTTTTDVEDCVIDCKCGSESDACTSPSMSLNSIMAS